MKTVFATVGTTRFDELVETMSSPEGIQTLKDLGYQELILQVGNSALLPEADHYPQIKLEAFRFKQGIGEEMKKADLIISHAGAGSCLEALGLGKALLVVVNDKLMDNHQLELAQQLHKDSHLFYCTCSTLTETLRTMDLSSLQPFPPGEPQRFASFLDKALGL